LNSRYTCWALTCWSSCRKTLRHSTVDTAVLWWSLASCRQQQEPTNLVVGCNIPWRFSFLYDYSMWKNVGSMMCHLQQVLANTRRCTIALPLSVCLVFLLCWITNVVELTSCRCVLYATVCNGNPRVRKTRN
jgi:hypothetical protein